jgi:hypothetical protein
METETREQTIVLLVELLRAVREGAHLVRWPHHKRSDACARLSGLIDFIGEFPPMDDVATNTEQPVAAEPSKP